MVGSLDISAQEYGLANEKSSNQTAYSVIKSAKNTVRCKTFVGPVQIFAEISNFRMHAPAFAVSPYIDNHFAAYARQYYGVVLIDLSLGVELRCQYEDGDGIDFSTVIG